MIRRVERTPGHAPARARTRGQALVEFAFVFPVIAMMAFAFIDIGRAVFAWNTLTNAAREATRVAAVNQLDPASAPWKCMANHPVEDPLNPSWTFRGCAMTAGAAIGVTNSDVTVSYAPPPGTNLSCTPALNIGCIVTITIATDWVAITPLAGQFIGPMAMTTTSSMPVERIFP
jgi:Flp pilus assembly protein TadG